MPESKKQKQKQTNKKSSQTNKNRAYQTDAGANQNVCKNVPVFQTETL